MRLQVCAVFSAVLPLLNVLSTDFELISWNAQTKVLIKRSQLAIYYIQTVLITEHRLTHHE